MKEKLTQSGLIPLDKSWIIRMGVLDIINGKNDISKFLDSQKNLSDDLLALKKVAHDWSSNKEIDVGESGTLYRLLKFVSWKLGLNKEFVLHGTLKDRKINDNSNIVNWSQKKLLELDNQTSQWASAAVLLGDEDRIEKPPFKLQITYEAVEHWHSREKTGLAWQPRYDETILKQALVYLELLKSTRSHNVTSGKIIFVPEQAEDFCFAYTFGFITTKDGEKRWPSLRGHESDRVEEMRKTLKDAKSGLPITSKDHRVVQAIAMWGKINNLPLSIKYPQSVNKSWPQFWTFLL